MTTPDTEAIGRIRDEIRRRRSFLISSHARPDGDSIGSQLALAYALRALGKQVRVVNSDPPPPHLRVLPGAGEIEIAPEATGDCEAAIIIECSDLARTGVAGLSRYFVINIDHHPGNTGFGEVGWIDLTAAACGEMVFELIRALEVPIGIEIATGVYVAILTDTGSFHHSNITARTFGICRQLAEAGVDPAAVARLVYHNSSLGRLKLFGSVLGTLTVDPTGRIALIHLDRDMAAAAGTTSDDTDGLINMPLTVGDIGAVAFLKQADAGSYRVSLRSKGDVDVGAVAKQFGGGGHRNAAGCTIEGSFEDVRALVTERLGHALDRASTARAPA